MRAQEFIFEDSTIDLGIGKYLKKHGYRYLGRGVDQEAYLEPGTGHVLKIFGTDCGDQLSEDQQMFMEFANLCQNNAGNPHLPRIYGVETFVWPSVMYGEKKNCIYLQIRMEALQPLTFDEPQTDEYDDYDEYEPMSLMAIMVEEGDTLQDFLERYTDGASEELLKNPVFLKTMEGMWGTLSMLYSVGRRKGYGWDAPEENNIMQRSDGTPVVVDPWNLGY